MCSGLAHSNDQAAKQKPVKSLHPAVGDAHGIGAKGLNKSGPCITYTRKQCRHNVRVAVTWQPVLMVRAVEVRTCSLTPEDLRETAFQVS